MFHVSFQNLKNENSYRVKEHSAAHATLFSDLLPGTEGIQYGARKTDMHPTLLKSRKTQSLETPKPIPRVQP